MRTTLDLDDALLERAQRYAPGLSKTALLEAALKAFAEQEARKWLVSGAAWQPDAEEAPRRKSS